MSINYHTYVGPYVRCRVNYIDAPSYQIGCPNTGCPRYARPSGGDKHCRYCGAVIERVPTTERRPTVDAWMLIDAIGNTLTNASGDAAAEWSEEHSAHLWKANEETERRGYHLETPEDFYICEITAEQIREELEAFSQQFVGELEIFRSHYGADAVTIHWGIIQDYS